mgnify:CR=1 FL=1
MPAPSRRPRRRTARTSIVVHCKAYPFRFSWEQPTGRTGAPARHLKVAPNVCRRAPPPAPVRVWSGQAKTGLVLVRSRGRAASPLAAGIWVAQWDAAGRADALRPESGQTMHPRISAPSFGIPFSGGQGLPALLRRKKGPDPNAGQTRTVPWGRGLRRQTRRERRTGDTERFGMGSLLEEPSREGTSDNRLTGTFFALRGHGGTGKPARMWYSAPPCCAKTARRTRRRST